MVKIEIGKTYETAMGSKVEILFKTNDGSFVGTDTTTRSLAYFSIAGEEIYAPDGPYRISLVKEYKPLVLRYVNIYYDSYQNKCVCSDKMYLSQADASVDKNNKNFIKTIAVEVPNN